MTQTLATFFEENQKLDKGHLNKNVASVISELSNQDANPQDTQQTD